MTTTYVGKCSLCGGEVHVPLVWMGIEAPRPTCRRCHATREQRGPFVAMQPASTRAVTISNAKPSGSEPTR